MKYLTITRGIILVIGVIFGLYAFIFRTEFNIYYMMFLFGVLSTLNGVIEFKKEEKDIGTIIVSFTMGIILLLLSIFG